ncbi:MAG: phosphatidylserine decarboxylase [Deltaproteobacteria bacterium]|nr:phosphatidylserine decarboxylase [Deltaproteobacteria bacterium]
MKDAFLVNLLSVLPRRRLSRWMGGLVRLRLPGWIRRGIIRWYVGHYGVNLSECDGDVDDFPTLASFFTRALKPGVRQVAEETEAIVSPVDGVVSSVGHVVDGGFSQAGDLLVAAEELIGETGKFREAEYATIYLSPKDYHRVHSPREGRILGHRYRPGRLWPVFPAATRKVQGLFARNERVSVRLETDLGEVACVLVGAFGVGRMTLSFDSVVTNMGMEPADLELDPPVAIERCGELGRFGMGSTVILLFPAGSVAWEVAAGQAVRLGERIGTAQPL